MPWKGFLGWSADLLCWIRHGQCRNPAFLELLIREFCVRDREDFSAKVPFQAGVVVLLPHVCSSSKADTQCCVRASGQILSILAEGRKSKVRFPSASPVTAVGFRGRHWSCTTFGVKALGIPAYVLCFSVLLNLLLLNILETGLKSPLFCIHSGTTFSEQEIV